MLPPPPSAASFAARPSAPPNFQPAPPADTTSGIGPYRAGLHAQITRNAVTDAEIETLGATGAAVIEAVIAPDGHVISARVAHSSGIRPIDRAALAAVLRGGYRPFGARMPAGPITISVPITIAPN